MEPNSRAPAGAHRRRSLNEPIPIEVRVDAAHVPYTVMGTLKGAERHRWQKVAAVGEIWRLDDEWWRPRPVQRLYFQLLLEDGHTRTVYRDLHEGSWWLQRY